MSKVQYYCAASLDGYIAEADDSLGWLLGYEGSFEGDGVEPGPQGEGGAYERFYAEVGALVSGSTSYEFVLKHGRGWPYGGKPYWVLSSRELPAPEGQDIRFGGTFEEMIASAGDRKLWIVGGGGVANQFAEAGLLDEVWVTVVPVALGEGKALFDRRLPGGPMQLTGVLPRSSGMVELRYARLPA